jgi:preprotein translocase subunit SecB
VTESKQAQDVQFSLEKIFLKDISFESPAAPLVFLSQPTPHLNIQLGVEHQQFNPDKGLFEVVLVITATATHEDKTLFLVELQQAGVFQINGITGQALERTLEIACAYALLPFAREALNDLVSKGGFPQFLLNPINFDALYQQKQEALKQKVSSTEKQALQ